jgi:hypothetical protein
MTPPDITALWALWWSHASAGMQPRGQNAMCWPYRSCDGPLHGSAMTQRGPCKLKKSPRQAERCRGGPTCHLHAQVSAPHSTLTHAAHANTGTARSRGSHPIRTPPRRRPRTRPRSARSARAPPRPASPPSRGRPAPPHLAPAAAAAALAAPCPSPAPAHAAHGQGQQTGFFIHTMQASSRLHPCAPSIYRGCSAS